MQGYKYLGSHFINGKIIICFFLLGLITLLPVQGKAANGATKRVLFIGNSLSSVNNLPEMIAQLAQSRGDVLEFDIYAPGGYHFFNHSTDGATLEKIRKGKWDFVVLQEQSQITAFSPCQVNREVYPFAQKLCRIIREANPYTQIVFYMTMARKNGDPDNVRAFPYLKTYEDMQERINQSYLEMAQQNNAAVAPVGEVWAKMRRQYPLVNLYADNSHPNRTGTYLVACVFYETFFAKSSNGLMCPEGINEKDAQIIQEIASQVAIRH